MMFIVFRVDIVKQIVSLGLTYSWRNIKSWSKTADSTALGWASTVASSGGLFVVNDN